MAHTFVRAGRLVQHGDADRLHRPDAIEFQGRAGQSETDWLAETTVWIDRWPTRAGVAELLELGATVWTPRAFAMPFDAIQVIREQEVKLVFSVWVPLVAGGTYRLYLPGAVLTRPSVRIGAIFRHHRPDERQPRRRPDPRWTSGARRAS